MVKGDFMVNLGNDWDIVLKGEFEKPYYLAIREFLKKEYSTQTIYPDMYDIYNALKEYNVNITVDDPWANPAIAKHEYGIEVTNELPTAKFDTLIMGVAHNEFKELDVTNFVKENHVIFDVKGTLPKDIVDARL